LGSSLPPTELARWDSGVFEDLKCLFSTTPEAENFSKSSWIETAANGGHWCDRTRSRHDRTRPVSVSTSSQARELGFATGASGLSWNQSVQSRTQRTARVSELIGRGGTSGHVRLDASDHARSSLDPYWTQTGLSAWHVRSFSQRVRSMMNEVQFI
jgi:hypothetical protein